MNKPELNKNISDTEFKNWYWYKDELVDFCRLHKLLTTGRKHDLAKRITYFLKTGKPHKETKTKKINSKQILPSSVSDPIPGNYTSSELYRKYFKSKIGNHFHFTAYMMKYIKSNPDITFHEYIEEWKKEHKRKKDKNYKPSIMKSCEYNQYIRDFFSNNKKHSLKNAIKCWKHKKSFPGNNKYSSSDKEILRR